MLFLFYAYRSLIARVRMNALTILSIALFVAGSATGLSVYMNLRSRLIDTTPPENVLVISRTSATERTSRLPREVAQQLPLLDGVAKGSDGQPLAAGEMVASVGVNTTDFTKYVEPVTIRGIDERSIPIHRVKVIQGVAPGPGTLEAIVGKRLARQHSELAIGQVISLPGGSAKVVGIFDAGGSLDEDEVWTPRAALELHLKTKYINAMSLVATSPAAAQQLVDKINNTKGLEARAQTLAAYRASGANLSSVLRIVLMLLILLAVVAAAAIATTMDASVAIRLPELAALAAIGVRRGVLARLLIFEGVLLASLGTMLGIIFAEAIRHSIGSFDLGGTTIELASKPVVQVAAAALGVVVGTVGTFKPSLVVARLDLRLAMR